MSSESPRSGVRAPSSWEHYGLWRRVRQALFAVPDRFVSPTRIEGLLVQDIFTLNAPLAATIEEQVVETLNRMRAVWDPDGAYETYAFERQSQTFPDVILRRTDNGSEILLGIELKGWYLLASEGVPTYRFTTTAAACNPWDLLVVVPWVLADVLSGSPVLHPPFVESARYCAERRNEYWQQERTAAADAAIEVPAGVRPYPAKSDPISDKPARDAGRNFGRLARYGIMDDYLERTRTRRIRGIPAREWLAFFKSQSPSG